MKEDEEEDGESKIILRRTRIDGAKKRRTMNAKTRSSSCAPENLFRSICPGCRCCCCRLLTMWRGFFFGFASLASRKNGDLRAFLICIQRNYKLGRQECDGDVSEVGELEDPYQS